MADAEETCANVASSLDNACLSEDSDPEESAEEWASESEEDYCSPSSPGR